MEEVKNHPQKSPNSMRTFPDNRFSALEEVKHVLRFRASEWRHFLTILGKTDNRWLQYWVGDLHIDLKKFIDSSRLHLRLKWKRGMTVKTAEYIFDLNELGAKKPKPEDTS
jgi:hypothetical protein